MITKWFSQFSHLALIWVLIIGLRYLWNDIPILAIHQLTYSLYQRHWNNWVFAGRIEVPPQTHGMCSGWFWLPGASLHCPYLTAPYPLPWNERSHLNVPSESGVLSNIRARLIFAKDLWPLCLIPWLTLAKGMFIDVILANSVKMLKWAWPFEVTVISVRA